MLRTKIHKYFIDHLDFGINPDFGIYFLVFQKRGFTVLPYEATDSKKCFGLKITHYYGSNSVLFEILPPGGLGFPDASKLLKITRENPIIFLKISGMVIKYIDFRDIWWSQEIVS